MGERYEIKERIGQGGLGAVYRAIDSQLKREVALKRLLPPEEGEAAEVDPENLINEAKTLSSLQHPNIVSVYDVGKDDEGAFVVMELLKGETFDETVERGALNEKDFRSVVLQTMEALVAAHHADIIHRDLKPSNLMVNWLPSGKFQIKILDFGLAKFGNTPEVQTTDQGDAILGSIYFMAPEQFERVPLDPRTDLYSMGALYHYCLTGQYPFNGDSAPQVMAAHLQNRVQALHELRPDLPQWMCDWVMWLISRNMDDRPATAKEAFDYFHAERSGGQAETPQPVPGAAPVAIVAPAQAAPPPPAAGAYTAPLAAAAPPGSIPVAQVTGPLTAQGMPEMAPPRKSRFPVPIWGVITIPVLLIAIVVVYLTKSGAKRVIDERNEMVLALNQAETPRGDGETVAAFVDFMKDQDTTSNGKNNVMGALTTLSRMKGDEVGSALIEQAQKAPTKLRAGLLGVLIDRGETKAIPVFLKNIDHKDTQIREASIHGLGTLGSGDNIKTLIGELEKPSSDKIAGVLSSAIVEISRKEPDFEARSKPLLAALNAASSDAFRHRLLQILGSMGGDATWRQLQDVLTNGDVESRKAVLRGLGNWPDGQPADRVFQIASNDGDGVIRGLALRTFVSLAIAPSDTPEETRVEQISTMLSAENIARSSTRDLLNALASMATPAAVAYADSLASDPKLGSYSTMISDEVGARAAKRKTIEGAGVVLKSADAMVLGEGGFKHSSDAAAVIGWTNVFYYVWWPVEFSGPGTYEMVVNVATPPGGGGEFALTLAGGRLIGETPSGSRFNEISLGDVEIKNAGTYRLTVEGARLKKEGEGLMQLRSVELKTK